MRNQDRVGGVGIRRPNKCDLVSHEDDVDTGTFCFLWDPVENQSQQCPARVSWSQSYGQKVSLGGAVSTRVGEGQHLDDRRERQQQQQQCATDGKS